MRICFLYFGPQQEAIAQVMIASVRKHMPNAVLCQLTDTKTKRLTGVDECRRIDGSTYGYLLMRHMATCPLPFIRVDYDMIFQGDISHILEGDHDLAFNEHGDDGILSTEFGKAYSLATCIWGATEGGKAHQFAREYREHHLKSGRDDWLGLIPSANELAVNYKVKRLAGKVYNYCPKDREDKPESALVIHYKGKRKKWMLPPEQAHLARIDEQRVMERVEQYGNPEGLVRGA